MKTLFTFIFTIIFASNIFAQEKLVSFSYQSYTVVTKEIAEHNNWFKEYPSFKEAKFYKMQNGNYALEVFYKQQDSLFKKRIEMTSIERQLFIDSLMKQPNATKTILNQQGRVPLIIGSTLVSLGDYGTTAAIITSRNTESSKWPITAYMFTASTGILVPYYVTRNKDISLEQASIVFHGQSRGIIHGVGLSNAIKPNMSSDWVNGIGAATSIAEGFFNYNLSKKLHLTGGQTSMYQFGIDAGLLQGILVSDMLDLMENSDKSSQMWTTIISTSAVMGAAGIYLGKVNDYTTGDAVALRSSVLLGALIPMPFIKTLYNPEDSKPYTTAMFAGGISGYAIGHYIFRNHNLTLNQGMYITLSEIASGLLGLGTSYLISPEELDGDKLADYLLWGSTIGAVTGYGLMSAIATKRLTKKTSISCDFDFNPAAFYYSSINRNADIRFTQPIASCKIAF